MRNASSLFDVERIRPNIVTVDSRHGIFFFLVGHCIGTRAQILVALNPMFFDIVLERLVHS